MEARLAVIRVTRAKARQGERAARLGFSGFGLGAALLGSAAFLVQPMLYGQVVKAPRYTGGIDAPVQQVNLPPLPPAITAHGTVVEDVVVRVNDQIISRSDVTRAEESLQQEAAQSNAPAGELLQREKDMLRDMIDQQLLLSRAKELGLNVDNELIKQLDEIRKQNKLGSLDDLEKAARSQGVNFEDFKAKIRNQLLTQQVVRDEVGRRLQLSQADEDAYYQAHLKEFEQPEQVRLSEILVPLPETATPAEIVQAERKANGLKTEVMQGGDFAAVAKKSSQGPSAAQGGELGLFKRGTLAKVLEDQTFDLKPGESTQPIRTRQGFVILKVVEHQAAGPATEKSVEPQIQEALYTEAMQPAMRSYLTKLREDSYVDLQAGFVDSGASAKETKPVFTAYVPPAAKKPKVSKDKSRFDRSGHRVPAASSVAAAKAEVISSPDTTGGRTLTGKEATQTVDPSTGLAQISKPRTDGKQAKVKREKVRFGQAPRNPLPGDNDEVATVGTQTPAPGAVLASGSNGLGGTNGTATTAGSAGTTTASPTSPNASLGSVSDVPAQDLADNPLNAHPGPQKKTRFAARSAEVKEQKVKVASAKQVDKIRATPTPASTEEKEATQTNAAPLGLNGDTSKKPAKPAKVKGAPKERLEDKKKPEPVAAPVIAPTASPALAPTLDTPAPAREPQTVTRPVSADAAAGQTKPAQTSDQAVPNSSVPRSVPNQSDTTLPPVSQPPPGSPQQGQPVPGVFPPH